MLRCYAKIHCSFGAICSCCVAFDTYRRISKPISPCTKYKNTFYVYQLPMCDVRIWVENNVILIVDTIGNIAFPNHQISRRWCVRCHLEYHLKREREMLLSSSHSPERLSPYCKSTELNLITRISLLLLSFVVFNLNPFLIVWPGIRRHVVHIIIIVSFTQIANLFTILRIQWLPLLLHTNNMYVPMSNGYYYFHSI